MEENNNNQMDIFTTGFVKPISLKEAVENELAKQNNEIKENIDNNEVVDNSNEIVNDSKEESANDNQIDSVIPTEEIINNDVSNETLEAEELNSNYAQNQEFINNAKNNDQQMKEKVEELIYELNSEDDKRQIRKNRKKTVKNILLIIGIIIEIIIIGYLINEKILKETYASVMTCTNNSKLDNYNLEMKNTYYFDKNDNVAKTESINTYNFKDKDSYEKFKENYVSSDIKNFKGIEQKSTFNDKKYTYENKTIYVYSLLKNNKKVTITDDEMIISLENRDEPITIYNETVSDVLTRNEESGFVCE